MTISLTELIAESDDIPDDIVATDKVLNLLLERPAADLRNLLFPLVREAVVHARRAATRAVEQRRSPSDSLAARRDLLAERFLVPGEGYVTWGDATEAQHLARSEYQRDSAEKLICDADRHDQAVREIRAAGVVCLNDLDHQQVLA